MLINRNSSLGWINSPTSPIETVVHDSNDEDQGSNLTEALNRQEGGIGAQLMSYFRKKGVEMAITFQRFDQDASTPPKMLIKVEEPDSEEEERVFVPHPADILTGEEVRRLADKWPSREGLLGIAVRSCEITPEAEEVVNQSGISLVNFEPEVQFVPDWVSGPFPIE